MPASAINGQPSPSNTAAYDLQAGNYSVPVGIPQGRATAQGHHPIRVSSLGTFIAGRGASQTVSLQIGSGGTNQFTVGAAGGAASTGQVALSFAAAFFLDGGTSTFSITQYGPCYYGWASSGQTITEPDGSTRAGATLVGYIAYYQAPTAPGTPVVTPGSTSASISWAAPADDGETAITAYRYEWSLSATFASGVSSGNTTARSVNITGLTAGQTYYFRVAARNGVTDQYGEWSAYSGTASASLGSAPGVPTALAVTAVPLDAAVAATWTAPASTGGSPIIDYSVQYDTDPGFGTATTYTGVTATNKTIPGLAPATSYYVRVAARNAIGLGAYSAGVSATTPARTAFASVEAASLNLGGGVTASLRASAANPNVVQIGYTALTEGATWHAIATVPTTQNTGGHFSLKGGLLDLELIADPAGNLYVIGTSAIDPTALAVLCYVRTGTTNAWTAGTTLAQALGAGEVFGKVAATYVPGTGASPVASIFVLARRYGSVGAGSLVYATVRVSAALAGSGTLLVATAADPTWLSTPPTSAPANSGALDVQKLGTGLTRVAIIANTRAVVDVINGVVSGVSKGVDGAQDYSGTTGGVRVVGVNATTFALVYPTSTGDLTIAFYGTNGTLLGSATIVKTDSQGGAFSRQWDAFYNAATGQLAIYYVADDSALKVERVDVSPVTFNKAAAVIITTTLGAAGSTNPDIRVPHGVLDERRIYIEAANVSSGGVPSTVVYSDTSNNQAPAAPALATRANYDATSAVPFSWTFSDGNPADTQTAYQFVVEKVSDGTTAFDSGKVASSAATLTLAANALTNGIAYRWKVRVYDALDAASAYSAYGTFSTSAVGTLTITDPAADGSAPLTNTYNVKWTYTQANGYTQAQRRVRVTRTDTGVLLSDTGMVSGTLGTLLNYTVGPLPSDVPVRIDLDIINSNSQTVPTVSRTMTPSYAAPMAPSVNLIPGSNYVEVDVLNPPPVGSRPEAASNAIQKRLAGSSDAFVTIATVGYAGTYLDRAVASGEAYEYRAIASDS